MCVIVMIRHPLGFTSSLKRLNWRFDFSHWSNQKGLMGDLHAPLREKIAEYAREEKDIIDQAILMWNAMYSVVHRYQQAHPDWMFVKHEDLAAAPLEGFQRLYEHCGLTWNDRARSKITAWSDARNPQEVTPDEPGTIKRDSKATIKAWKRRLSQEEIERVRTRTSEIAAVFYEDADWD